MSSIDRKILFTALGFLAVLLNDTPKDKQALRATAVAGLIESFCATALPEAFGDDGAKDLSLSQRMAQAVVSVIKLQGECHPHNLNDHGFAADEIARHWPMAYSLACVALNIEPRES